MNNISFDFKNIYSGSLMIRGLIIGLVCAIVFYLGYLVDIAGLKKQLVVSQQQEADLKRQLELTILKQAVIRDDLSQFSELQRLLNRWQKEFITYAELPQLIDKILKIGAANHLHFSLFNPGAEVKEGLYYKIPIKVIVAGNYHQLADFVSQVANMPSIVVVGNFIVSNENRNDVLGAKLAAQAAAENLLTATLILEVYRLAE